MLRLAGFLVNDALYIIMWIQIWAGVYVYSRTCPTYFQAASVVLAGHYELACHLSGKRLAFLQIF